MNLPREILWLPLILAQVAAFDRWNSTAYNLKIGPAVRTMEMAGYQFTQGARVGSWILRIMKGNDFACGASYISALYALTSANCMHIYRSELSALKVEFVMPDQDDQERSFALVSSVYVPGQWQYGDTYMDVAVIKLSNSLRGNLEDFVRLCRKPCPTTLEWRWWPAAGIRTRMCESNRSESWTGRTVMESTGTLPFARPCPVARSLLEPKIACSHRVAR